ncbi:MAG: F0F1 ATP synthase subunit A [Firmicutes bacterium]|nr:F0F1 ATP synthase subunit A [Bacillota bacterium]
MLLPILAGILLKILFTPASSGIQVTGPMIFFTIPMPVQDLPITESQVNSWLVVISITFLCLYLTHGIQAVPHSKRQIVAEWIVEKTDHLVRENMGDFFMGFVPFIGAILGLSAFSSLLSLFGLFPPTSDLNVVAGWAIMVFVLITHYKLKGGIVSYSKSFLEPTPVLLPINIISEFATPVSMAFRHYGNVMSGSVVSVLVVAALQGLSNMLLGWLPGFLGEIPFLQVGLPAILSVYFDLFSGCLQAFIFAMLTMMYVSGGFPKEDYERKMARKAAKNQ